MSKLAAVTGHGEPSQSYPCDFCDEFADGTHNAFYARYRETPRNRVLLSTENFRVFPSIGQLLDGYLLIAPVGHYTALDGMPVNLVAEFVGVCKHVRAVLSQTYDPCVCFEHGARGPVNGGCGIYHAHLHVTPLARVSDPVDILKLRFPYTELAHLNELGEQSRGLSSYLFYQDLDARLYLFDTGPLPSQYMRKLLADALCDKGWDWRAFGREERLVATIERLSGQFDTVQKSAETHQGTKNARR